MNKCSNECKIMNVFKIKILVNAFKLLLFLKCSKYLAVIK